MKIIKDWKFILLISLIFIYLSLFSVLYTDKIQLPSENWSKEIEITKYNAGDFDRINYKDVDLIKSNDKFVLSYYTDKKIILEFFDNNFNSLKKMQINQTIDNLTNLKLSESSDNFIIKYTTKENKLYQIILDKNGDLKNNKLLVENYEYISFDKNNYLYTQDSKLYLNSKYIYDVYNIEQLDHESKNGELIVGYTTFNSDNYKFYLNSLIIKDNKVIKSNNIDSFVFASNAAAIDFDVGYNDNENFIITIFKNQKFGINNIKGYSINNNLELLNNFDNTNNVYNTNLQIINNSDFNYVINDKIPLNRVDISTKNEKFNNLLIYNKKEKVKELTKNSNNDIKSRFYQFDIYNYLIFGERDGNFNKIYVSSNNPKLIDKSQNLKSETIQNLMLTTLTTFFPVFYLGLIPGIGFLLPVIFILVPLSLIKINWAENNPKKIMLISFGIYMLMKIRFTIFNFGEANLPIYYSNLFIRLAITIIFTLIALYCLYDYKKGRKIHFIKQMAFFYVIDIVMFILLFTPYYML